MTGNTRQPHAIIIGSGFGGLAAAVRLQARGYRTTVLERRARPGGRADVHRQDGFVFDAGPTVITAPFLLEELWTLGGRNFHDEVDLREVDPFYRIHFHDRSTFDYVGDAERMEQQIEQLLPSDVKGYQRLLETSRNIFDVGFQKLAHVPFDTWGDMLRIVPAMMKLRSYKSVYGLVANHVKNDKLRQVLSFHPLLVGGNPFDTTSIYALIMYLERKWGVHFPMGGTNVLVSGLVNIIEDMGGSVQCGVGVKQIRVQGQRATGVELDDGTVIDADIVVSNADSAFTYQKLIPDNVRSRWTGRAMDKKRFSMGLYVWYFGTNRKYDDVAHHTILLGPRYRGLLDDIFHKKVLADDFSLYLHRPTATDPSLAPDGCDGFYVLSPVPHLDAGIDWNQAAEPYRQRIENYLSETVLPGLGDSVISSRVLTPQGFQDDLSSIKGAAFGLEPVLTQSAYFRPHNRSEDIDGLYLVGAGTHPGAGVPGVLSSARVLDQVVPDAVETLACA